MRLAVLVLLTLLPVISALSPIGPQQIPPFYECSNYKTLDEADRSMNSPASPFNEKCDNAPTAWYRFSGAAGTMMPTSSVAKNMCGTNAPGWLKDGQHPSQLGARIQATVCFHWENEPCKWSTQILIRNCGSFYVYLLPSAPHCNLRYCGNGIQSSGSGSGIINPPGSGSGTGTVIINPPVPGQGQGSVNFQECSNYKTLDEADRSMNSPASPFNEKCDNAPTAWYRFSGAAGTMMPTSSVAKNMCGTNAPGWVDGQHPSQLGARIQAKVCFHWENQPCKWSTQILIRNCGSFYVYLLPPAPHCHLRYCGNGL